MSEHNRNYPDANITPTSASPFPGPNIAKVRMMTYPFSVREDVVAELRLPVDLTVKEAERLAQFIAALVVVQAAWEG